MKLEKFLFASVVVAFSCVYAVDPGVSPGPGVRYATDAYPGFDLDDGNFKPEKKEPRLFGWIYGPKMEDAASQFAWAAQLEADNSVSGARKAYDALVREWPTSPEAPKAQLKVAQLLSAELDYEESFKEYRYLIDFYSNSCDFSAVVQEMYKLAELMREEGKTILFFNFRNTVDVRRAYESLVLRAPGADFVPKAMLTIAGLREDEEHLSEAVAVYENLRNIYPTVPEAAEAAYNEARTRMNIVRDHEYNRNRVRDTADYIRQTISGVVLDEAKVADLRAWLSECEGFLEDEAWKAAKFYDSPTRTKGSAVNAYNVFLKDYPAGVHAEEARARIAELGGAVR